MSQTIDLLVHITHEAGVKLGGIGAVLDGLLGSPAYNAAIRRSIVVGPLNVDNPGEMERLLAPRQQLRLRYASFLDIDLLPATLGDQFRQIESTFHVDIAYGVRPFGGVEHEVLLVNVADIDRERVAGLKYFLWDTYGLDCARYESDPEFSRFVHLAEPAYAALFHLTAGVTDERLLLAHEWMGLPLALTAKMKDPHLWRTVFYAHEVATARHLVEGHPGHDTRFYNAMRVALDQDIDLDTVFGDQSFYFKHSLLQQAVQCDAILAVGDQVVDELRFLGGAYRRKPIDLVYNGAPAAPLSLDAKKQSKALLQQYARNLLGYAPDFIFSHVTRFVISKAIWRDLRVLTHLDEFLASAGKRALLFILSSSEPSGRPATQVWEWEQTYGWPLEHRTGNGDLLGYETGFFFNSLKPFNQNSRAIKAVLVNQFGWSQQRCGRRMPAQMKFMDLRQGSDLEFGQSIYEPFGISQVEPLSFGALCVVSNVCGCVGFVQRASADLSTFPNFVVADYVTTPPDWIFQTPYDALRIDQYGRDLIEIWNSQKAAELIAARLPMNDQQTQELLDLGQEVGARMSWDVVVQDYLLPALQRAKIDQ